MRGRAVVGFLCLVHLLFPFACMFYWCSLILFKYLSPPSHGCIDSAGILYFCTPHYSEHSAIGNDRYKVGQMGFKYYLGACFSVTPCLSRALFPSTPQTLWKDSPLPIPRASIHPNTVCLFGACSSLRQLHKWILHPVWGDHEWWLAQEMQRSRRYTVYSFTHLLPICMLSNLFLSSTTLLFPGYSLFIPHTSGRFFSLCTPSPEHLNFSLACKATRVTHNGVCATCFSSSICPGYEPSYIGFEPEIVLWVWNNSLPAWSSLSLT